MTPTNIIDSKKMEQLLIANWTKFIDPSKLMALVLFCIRDAESLDTSNSPVKANSTQITLSRLTTSEIWVDFVIPQATHVVIGTCELTFDNNTVTPARIIGTRFPRED